MSLLESKIKFTHEVAEFEPERKRYTPGQHFSVVVSAAKKVSEEKPERPGVQYPMLQLNVKPLSDPEDINTGVGRGIAVFQCLPFWLPEWDELDYMTTTKEGQTHIQKYLEGNVSYFASTTRDLFAALLPDEVPKPVTISKGIYQYKGDEIYSEDWADANIESKKIAGEVAERLWNEGPEELINLGCFHFVDYDEKSKYPNSPQFSRPSAEQHVDRDTGEVIPVTSSIMEVVGANGLDTEDEGDEDMPKGVGYKDSRGRKKGAKASKTTKKTTKKKSTQSRARA